MVGMLTATAYKDDKLNLPWWMAPMVYMKRRRLGIQMSSAVRRVVQRHYDSADKASSTKTILALSLKDVSSLTPQLMEETCDQLKTFLLAGHDTTSITIVWAVYELLRTPHALQAVRDELDQVFGTADIYDSLVASGGGALLARLTYLSAVMREVLRLHPPAGSCRAPPGKAGITVKTSQGDHYNLNENTWVYINHYLIHRDKAVYGDNADIFCPERWLNSGDAKELPASAWRPFERGPRNCIGQELANIEGRAAVALLARRFDFTKVGLGELELDERGLPTLDERTRQFKVKSELYPVSCPSAYVLWSFDAAFSRY